MNLILKINTDGYLFGKIYILLLQIFIFIIYFKLFVIDLQLL